MISHRIKPFVDLGGFIWWVAVRFCRTRLKEEQSEKHLERNVVLFLVVAYLLGYVTVQVT
ncbi:MULTISPECIES: hypothetical protein [unclassified Flavobacterium]|uniref:hypothetical protein n=1 Tax=unclassified Flavobacterium TaxID=196869 RepID=UPI001F13803B|nr:MULTISPECIES: hypothetical protein [unclassified Flavobacterium]UMY65275.1 hypothetical protein MKO97_12295 [Flavobacterium sp. HJ-32-4]